MANFSDSQKLDIVIEVVSVADDKHEQIDEGVESRDGESDRHEGDDEFWCGFEVEDIDGKENDEEEGLSEVKQEKEGVDFDVFVDGIVEEDVHFA